MASCQLLGSLLPRHPIPLHPRCLSLPLGSGEGAAALFSGSCWSGDGGIYRILRSWRASTAFGGGSALQDFNSGVESVALSDDCGYDLLRVHLLRMVPYSSAGISEHFWQVM